MSDPTTRLVLELVGLRRSRRSGRVEVRTGELTTTLVIAGGEVVGVNASRPGEPLGRILTRKGLLTQEQYIDVLERMSSALALGEKIRFGEIAVELGYVDQRAVRECLTEQQRLLAARVFQSASPTWSFEEDVATPAAGREGTMQIEALFLDAVRWADDARKGALGLDASRAAPLSARWELDEIEARFDLTHEEAEFVSKALAEDKTVAELLEDRSGAESVDIHAILTALLATGAAAPAAQPKVTSKPSARPPGGRKVPPPLPEWTIDAERARSALAKIVLAKISVPPVATESSRSVEQQLRSEQAFLRGKELLRSARTAAALTEFERALELKPDSAEYKLFVMWTRESENTEGLTPAARAELELLANAALRENSKLAFGYFVLGEVLRDQGSLEDGRRHLRHALRLEPDLFAGLRSHRLGAVRRASQPSIDTANARATVPPPSEVKPDEAETVPVAAKPVPEAAPAAAKPVPLPSAPRRLRPTLLIALGVVVVAGGATIAFVERSGGTDPTSPRASPPRIVPPIPALASDASASTDASTDASTSATPIPDAGTKDAASTAGDDAGARDSGATLDATRGVLVLGPSALGHRIFIDGRVVPTADGRVTVSCGRHDLRVGSQGKSASIDVPCGRELIVP